jgi:hypothetical protein
MPSRISTRDLLEDLRRVYELPGNMTRRKYIDKGKYSMSTLLDRFGSYNNALKTEGLPFTERGKHIRGKTRKGKITPSHKQIKKGEPFKVVECMNCEKEFDSPVDHKGSAINRRCFQCKQGPAWASSDFNDREGRIYLTRRG